MDNRGGALHEFTGVVGIVVGLVGLIRPIQRFMMQNRRQAGLVVGASFVQLLLLLLLGGALTPTEHLNVYGRYDFTNPQPPPKGQLRSLNQQSDRRVSFCFYLHLEIQIIYTVYRYMLPGVLREPTFLILSAVTPAPLHGYGILGAVEELSVGRIRLRAGTLYAALDRMVGDGWLQVDREEVVDGRLRRYYRITAAGLEALDRDADRLEANASTARRQLARRLNPGMS